MKTRNRLFGTHDPDELLSTKELAAWLGSTKQWLEQARMRDDGPPYYKLGTRKVRYRRGDVVAWLNQRRHNSTAEYST